MHVFLVLVLFRGEVGCCSLFYMFNYSWFQLVFSSGRGKLFVDNRKTVNFSVDICNL